MRPPVVIKALLKTSPDSGLLRWDDLVQRSIFGVAMNPDAPHNPDEGNHVLAARIQGQGGAGPLNAIVIADADLMSEWCAGCVSPLIDIGIPGVSGLAQIGGELTFLRYVGEILSGEQSRDFDCHRVS